MKTPLQQMDELLSRESEGSNAELIRLLRMALFADVDALEKSGQVVLPE